MDAVLRRNNVRTVPPDAVVQRLPVDTDLNARNVADHIRNAHLPITDPAVIAYQERIAARDGATAESAVAAVANYLKLARLVVGQVSQRMTDGDAIPSVRDGLAAVRLLSEFDRPPAIDPEGVMLGFFEYVTGRRHGGILQPEPSAVLFDANGQQFESITPEATDARQ